MSKDELKIIIYGAGAIGSTVGGWLHPHSSQIFLKARGEHASAMRKNGLTLYLHTKQQKNQIYRVKVIENLEEVPNADIVIFSVKNYDLEEAAKDVSSKFGSDITVISLQNYVEPQKILPKYFKNIIYGVVAYNAWIDKPGEVGYEQKGPIILGILDDSNSNLKSQLEKLNKIFNMAFNCEISDRIQDTIHCKLLINVTSSVLTLIGMHDKKITDFKKLSKISTTILQEGLNVIKAAGIKEYKIKNLPTWRTINLAKKVPAFLTTFIFKRKAKHYVVSSMEQDIIVRKKAQSELEYVNGYILELAKKYNIKAPYNEIIYNICKETFNRKDFQPLSVEELWNKINTSQ